MKRVCILGNGPLSQNYSEFIDSSDIVIRINDCKNYGNLGGEKIDYLFVTNTGLVVRQILYNLSLINNEPFLKLKKIFIVRNLKSHSEHLELVKKSELKSRYLLDYTAEIIQSFRSSASKIESLSYNFNKNVFDNINYFPLIILTRYIFLDPKVRRHFSVKNLMRRFYYKRKFLMPSTGMFTIIYTIEKIMKAGDELHLFGFTFEGWHGHAWAVERALCNELVKLKKLNFHDH